jgi:hypothetical protein
MWLALFPGLIQRKSLPSSIHPFPQTEAKRSQTITGNNNYLVNVRDCWFLDFFLETFKICWLVWIFLRIFGGLECVSSMFCFKVITNLKCCLIKDHIQKHFCIIGWCLEQQRNP